MATVVIASVIAAKCRNGGNAAAVLNWVQGFRKLGVRTYFIEQIAQDHCVDERGSVVPFEESVNLAYFQNVMADAGLAATSSLVCSDGSQSYGVGRQDLLAIAEDADLLLNVTGHLTLEPLMRRLRRKAYLDLDPGYTQFWHASGQPGARLQGHDFYFTIGENIGTPECSIPTSGIPWRHTRQPIVLTNDEVAGDTAWNGRFTTVASWRGSYGPAQYGGDTFGLKVHEFRKFIDLPLRTAASFEVALDIHPADGKDLAALRSHEWSIVDPRQRVPDPRSFDEYIHGSDAEWSVAQGVYVSTNSGWFSDRTARYLAAGKPALVQDTGFSRTLPVGEGLIAFRTMDDAVRGVQAIERDAKGHREASRAMAQTYFESNGVIGRLLDDVKVVA